MTFRTRLATCVAGLVAVGCSDRAAHDPLALVAQLAAVQEQVQSLGKGDGSRVASELLTDGEIQEITGFTVAGKKPGRVQGIYANGCEWQLQDTKGGVPWTIVLGVVSPGGSKYFDSYLTISGETPIAGLGDKAAQQIGNGVAAVKGDTLVDVQYVEFPKRPEIQIKLIEAIFRKLP